MKIVFKGPEENLEEEEEGIPCSHLKNGTLFKFGDGVFFISSASYEYRKLMTRLDTGATFTAVFNLKIRKKDIIPTRLDELVVNLKTF